MCYNVSIPIGKEKKMFVRFRLTFEFAATGNRVSMFFRTKEEAEKAILLRSAQCPHKYTNFQIKRMEIK